MGAIACHKAQRVAFKYAPTPRAEPDAFAIFGLLIVYLVVLTVGIVADFSIEKFESTMNVATLAGFAGLCAAFRGSRSRNGTDDERGLPHRNLRHHTVSGVSAHMMTKKPGSRSDRWGPAATIGFLNE